MQKLNSISLLVMGTGFLPLAMVMENMFLKCAALLISIVLNIIAIVRNFKEKRENNL
ncbi:hypothetical protein [Flavobacterium selenitireducens]|uniref:hypothetical protein n=1 Tax=Flavobacterium selenitireducens TaxID=2722704 RepID=UPI00168BCF1E|nr:hypothetical protein [Flavobacterium selenitireducens]MBD3583376.1 hypothetical protein [Flavobacterium selenitireducens]